MNEAKSTLANSLPREWVNDSQRWETICQQWLGEDFPTVSRLAIDTEFERRTTFYPIFALLQVFDGNKIYIVDPQIIRASDNFKKLCADRSIIKIMHAGKEDLDVLYHLWDCKINNYFDTQVVNAFVCGEASLGYAALVERVCGVTLDKQQTQSDWLIRPLSNKQIDYAANDVAFLFEIYDSLIAKVENQPFEQILNKELAEIGDTILGVANHQDAYRQAKDVSKLNGRQLPVFKMLFDWREVVARSQNKTRNHIFKDHQLVEICIRLPKSKKALQQIDSVHPKAVRVYGDEVLDLLQSTLNQKLAPLQPVINPRDIQGLKPFMNKLSKDVEKVAKNLGVQSSLVMSKRQLRKVAVSLITGETMPGVMNGWRGDYLMSDFRHHLSQFESSN